MGGSGSPEREARQVARNELPTKEATMDLDLLLESLDSIAEDQTVKLRDLYVPGSGANQGKFVLRGKPKGGLAIENVAALRKALEDEKKGASTARDALAKFRLEDGNLIDADAAKDALARIAEMGDDAPKNIKELEAKIEARLAKVSEGKIAEARRTAFQERDAHKALASKAIARLEEVLKNEAAARALAEHGGPAELLPLIVSKLRFQQRTTADGSPEWDVVAIDESGTPRTDPASSGTRPLPISDLVAEFKSHKVFGSLFAGQAGPGAGTNPGQNNNQRTGSGAGKVIKVSQADFNDPTKYRQLREQAQKEGATLDVSVGGPSVS